MTSANLVETLTAIRDSFGVTALDLKAKIKFKDDDVKADNFTLNVFDKATNDKLEKQRVRDGKLNKSNYFVGDQLCRTDTFNNKGKLVSVKQRNLDGKRAGSEIRLRKGVYQHRIAGQKNRWEDVSEDLEKVQEKAHLFVGPNLDQLSTTSQIFFQFVKTSEVARVRSNKLIVLLSDAEVHVFKNKKEKKAYFASDSEDSSSKSSESEQSDVEEDDDDNDEKEE